MYGHIDFGETELNDLSIVSNGLFKNLFNGRHRPHEWICIKLFYLSLLKKDKSLATKFVMFVAQFYSDYRWSKLDNDFFNGVMFELAIADYTLASFYTYEEDVDLKRPFKLGDIVTDFLIRCCDISIVGISNEKIIVTSQQDSDKRFEQYLLDGYSIERRHKLVYIDFSEELKARVPFQIGFYVERPILPTKDIGVPIDEFIETSRNCYVKVI